MYFDGKHLCDYLIVNDIRRYLLPPKETLLRRIPGNRGARFIKSTIAEGNIEVDITILGQNTAELRNNTRVIAGMLFTDEPKRLMFSDEPDKYYMAILDADTVLNEDMGVNETTLYFICPDPVAYGKLVRVNLNNNTRIYNNGTYPSKGIIKIEITEETDHLEVTLLNTGEFLYIDDNFDTGDIVVIDLEKEYITKNGHSAMPNLYLESDFFEIPVGEFEITISNGNGILEFRERWL